jgi:hypothetical protein
MSEIDREAVFNGGPFQSYWWADEHEAVHPAVSVTLADAVRPDALEGAWQAVKKAYPVTDLNPDDYDEEILFFQGEGKGGPLMSRENIRPVSRAADGRGFVLTWFENRITLGAYHSLVDEIGLVRIFSDFLKVYAAIRRGTAGEAEKMLAEKKTETCFVQSTMLVPKDYQPQKIMLYDSIRDIFTDPEAVNDPEGITSGRLVFSGESFDALCRRHGANEEEMLAYVFAKAVYALFPEENRKLSFGIMTDFRKVFGVEESIAPCSRRMPLVLSRDVLRKTPEEGIRLIAQIRERQKEENYVKSHVAMENSYAVLNLRNISVCINYAGQPEIGEGMPEIVDVGMSDASSDSVFSLRCGGKIYLSLQFGRRTAEYADAAAECLQAMGISDVEKKELRTIPAEVSAPVL